MDTRTKLLVLLDYNSYYQTTVEHSAVIAEIRNIPSCTLIDHLAWMNLKLYNKKTPEEAGTAQRQVIDSLINLMNRKDREKCISTIKQHVEAGERPALIYRLSILSLYDFVFTNYNDKPYEQLNQDDAKKVFDAFLAINTIINAKIGKNKNAILASKQNEDEFIENMVASFMYQKDYESSTDFPNQVVRGKMFFDYLASHVKFQPILQEFCKERKLRDYRALFKNLMALFVQINLDKPKPNYHLSVMQVSEDGDANLEYLESLVVDSIKSNYKPDVSFTYLRNKFLYKIDKYRLLILDVNFLFDQFYKTQVFVFHDILKKNGYKEFLSTKGKEFLEVQYFTSVIADCFPSYVSHFGDVLVNSKNKELCDGYLRSERNVCLIELKDVLINAEVKNSCDRSRIREELLKKFVENENGKKKGIGQLRDAIADVNSKGIAFDSFDQANRTNLYPVIVYTDNSFGTPGLNNWLARLMTERLPTAGELNLNVRPLTLINLNFFEMRRNYLVNKDIDFFETLDAYHAHVSHGENKMVPFETFSTSYLIDNGAPSTEVNPNFKTVVTEIINS